MINTTSARLAIAIATAHGHRAGAWFDELVRHSSPTDTTSAALHNLDAGRVLAAVDACAEPVREWLLWCYGADGCVPARLLHGVTATLYREAACRRTLRTTPGRAANLAGAVAVDMRERCRAPHRAPAPPGAFAKAVGLAPNRAVGLMPTVEFMRAIIEGWDATGIRFVASKLPYLIREMA